MSAVRMELRQPAVIVLGVALLVGALLRGWFMLAWRPGLLGFPDTVPLLLSATKGPFDDVGRPTGYSRFIDALHVVANELSLIPLAQHGLGLASAVMLYVALRRLGAVPWAAVVPAVVVALHGTLIFLEHAVLTESLFLGLISAGLLLVAFATAPGTRALVAVLLCVAAGLLLGYATWVRIAGFFVLPAFVAFVALAGGDSLRRRLTRAAALAAASLAVVFAISEWHRDVTGRGGYTLTGFYNTYGRVAPWADCKKFDPPEGTAMLCPTIPVEQREGHDYWLFRSESPLVKAYGPPFGHMPPPEASGRVSAFVRAAVRGQPLDYVEAVGRDLVRIVHPSFPSLGAMGNASAGIEPDALIAQMFDESARFYVDQALAGQYSTVGSHHGNVSALRDYESATRLTGVPMAIMLLLGLAAPLAARPGLRVTAGLLLASALGLMVMPILTSAYSWRYMVPAIPLLAGAAALAVDGLVARRRANAPARS
jgi:hypothetical protein